MNTRENIFPSLDGSDTVRLSCTMCTKPFELKESYGERDEQTLSEFPIKVYSNFNFKNRLTFEQDYQTSIYNVVSSKLNPHFGLTETENKFMFVDNILSPDFVNFHQQQVKDATDKMISGKSEVYHPMCTACTDNIVEEMNSKLRIDKDEYIKYHELVEQIDARNNEDDLEKLQIKFQKLKEEEFKLQTELCELEVKEQNVSESLKSCEEENEKLPRENVRFLQEYNQLKRQLFLQEDDQRSLDNQIHHAEALLDKFKKSNIFAATFHISHKGLFGKINNFRLGRLPTIPVSWEEINAAWGQTALLLHSLAKKIDLTFQRYRLVPHGSYSYLKSLDDEVQELPLYCFSSYKCHWDIKFDQAMVAFLDCLQQIQEIAEYGKSAFPCPYQIETGKIKDQATGDTYSIKIQFNTEEKWTQALKFMLTNLEWTLAWIASKFENS